MEGSLKELAGYRMERANILKGFDSSKHSGVIAYFNREYLKSGILEKSLSVIIKNSAFLREKSDYDDFFIASRKVAEKLLEDANIFVTSIEQFLKCNL